MADRFDGAEATYHWSTHDFMPVDRLPYIGPLWPGDDRILVATGFAKWGLTKGTLAAAMLTDRILGRPNAWAKLYDSTRIDPRHSVRRFAEENAEVGLRFVRDRLRPRPGRERVERLAPGEGAVVRAGGEAVRGLPGRRRPVAHAVGTLHAPRLHRRLESGGSRLGVPVSRLAVRGGRDARPGAGDGRSSRATAAVKTGKEVGPPRRSESLRMRVRVLLALAAASLALAAPASAPAANPQTAGLQVALRAYGFYLGPIDGISGRATADAIRAFQRSSRLPVDGIPGSATRRALGRLGRPFFGERTLRRARVGWDVSVLQFLLARHGIGRVIDGYFGAGDRGRGAALPAAVATRGRRHRRPADDGGTAGRAIGEEGGGRALRRPAGRLAHHDRAAAPHVGPVARAREQARSGAAAADRHEAARPRVDPGAAGGAADGRALPDHAHRQPLRARPRARARGRVDGVRLPAARRLHRRRARRDAGDTRPRGSSSRP